MAAEGMDRPESGSESRFDGVATTYDAVRPRYPDAVFEAIRAYGLLSGRPLSLIHI